MEFGVEETGPTETYGMPLNDMSNVTSCCTTLFAIDVISSWPLSIRDTESYTMPTIFVMPTFDRTPIEVLEMSNRTALRMFTSSPETVPYIDQNLV